MNATQKEEFLQLLCIKAAAAQICGHDPAQCVPAASSRPEYFIRPREAGTNDNKVGMGCSRNFSKMTAVKSHDGIYVELPQTVEAVKTLILIANGSALTCLHVFGEN